MSGIDPFLGEIALFPYTYVPKHWMPCDGQSLAIASHTALFALLGTSYGGDGRTTFALPNLNGRAALGAGQSPGLSSHTLGEQGGSETVTLLQSQLPGHVHTTIAAQGTATTGVPVDALPAAGNVPLHNTEPTAHEPLAVAGGGQPHNNMQPSLALRYCIAVQGIFPPRD